MATQLKWILDNATQKLVQNANASASLKIVRELRKELKESWFKNNAMHDAATDFLGFAEQHLVQLSMMKHSTSAPNHIDAVTRTAGAMDAMWQVRRLVLGETIVNMEIE